MCHNLYLAQQLNSFNSVVSMFYVNAEYKVKIMCAIA